VVGFALTALTALDTLVVDDLHVLVVVLALESAVTALDDDPLVLVGFALTVLTALDTLVVDDLHVLVVVLALEADADFPLSLAMAVLTVLLVDLLMSLLGLVDFVVLSIFVS
jgi:hypothetical protein